MDEWKYDPAKDLGLHGQERLKSLKRESGLIATMGHHAWWCLLRSYLAVYHRLSIEGRENIPPAPPFIMISNHSSHLDTLSLAAPLPAVLRDRIFPIAAGDTFFETPARAAMAALLINALPMWRRRAGRHALDDLRERLIGEPCAYILFPEGTRTRDGSLGRFKPGIGMMVAESAVPVVPCFLEGAYAALPPKKRVPRPRKLRLRIGEPLVFEEATNDRAGWEAISARCREAVLALESSD
jgi:1-acyl-sn-glycerol-3-phosphate acyltransferase